MRRLNFANGWSLDIDQEDRNGQVYYRAWPPGVDNQGLFDRAYRKDTVEFWKLANAEGYTEEWGDPSLIERL